MVLPDVWMAEAVAVNRDRLELFLIRLSPLYYYLGIA